MKMKSIVRAIGYVLYYGFAIFLPESTSKLNVFQKSIRGGGKQNDAFSRWKECKY